MTLSVCHSQFIHSNLIRLPASPVQRREPLAVLGVHVGVPFALLGRGDQLLQELGVACGYFSRGLRLPSYLPRDTCPVLSVNTCVFFDNLRRDLSVDVAAK